MVKTQTQTLYAIINADVNEPSEEWQYLNQDEKMNKVKELSSLTSLNNVLMYLYYGDNSDTVVLHNLWIEYNNELNPRYHIVLSFLNTKRSRQEIQADIDGIFNHWENAGDDKFILEYLEWLNKMPDHELPLQIKIVSGMTDTSGRPIRNPYRTFNLISVNYKKSTNLKICQ